MSAKKNHASHAEVIALTLWVNFCKEKLAGKTVDEIAALYQAEKGASLSLPMVRKVCVELGLIQVQIRRKVVTQSEVSKILARAVVGLYRELGQVVPDELWEIMGGEEEDE